MTLSTITTRRPHLIASAEDDGRVVVRGKHARPVNFILVGDHLKAEASEEQAAYFASIPGYAVAGRPEAVDEAWPAPQSWIAEGTRLAEEAKHGKQVEASAAQGTLAEQLLGLLGKDAILALLANQVKTEAPAVMEKAGELAETEAREAAAAEKARPWDASDTIRLDEDTARELAREFLPHLDYGAAPRASIAGELAKAANHSAYLDARLLELLGE